MLLGDQETVRLLRLDLQDYIDLFPQLRGQFEAGLGNNEGALLNYIQHIAAREIREGREMIGLMAHVLNRRIEVTNRDEYLRETFGRRGAQPLYLHFTQYEGTEPFPNHYDAYVPNADLQLQQVPQNIQMLQQQEPLQQPYASTGWSLGEIKNALLFMFMDGGPAASRFF